MILRNILITHTENTKYNFYSYNIIQILLIDPLDLEHRLRDELISQNLPNKMQSDRDSAQILDLCHESMGLAPTSFQCSIQYNDRLHLFESNL